MMNFIKNVIFILSLTGVLSCTPSVPYEIRSPCVSIEANDHSYGITPCVRRPINLNHAIA